MASAKVRLDGEVAELDTRIAKLDESARGLESGLDKRLGQMASNTMGEVRKQLESAVDEILIELETRSSRELSGQVNGRDLTIEGISRKSRLRLCSRSTARSQKRSAHSHNRCRSWSRSLERLRATLAGGLNAVVRNLGEHFREKPEAPERRWPAAD